MKVILYIFLLTLLPAGNQQDGPVKLEIKYLHGQRRCDSCAKIERGIRKTLLTHYRKEAERGEIVFNIYNLDDPEHREFRRKYEIWGSALILVANKGSETKTSDISELAHQLANNERQLVRMLKTEIERKLKE